MCGTGTLDKGTVLVRGGMEWAGMRVQHTTQDSEQLKTHKLLISGLPYLIFLDHGQLWATETMDTQNQG